MQQYYYIDFDKWDDRDQVHQVSMWSTGGKGKGKEEEKEEDPCNKKITKTQKDNRKITNKTNKTKNKSVGEREQLGKSGCNQQNTNKTPTPTTSNQKHTSGRR